MKKFISLIIVSVILSINVFSLPVFAQPSASGTLLPKPEEGFSADACTMLLEIVETNKEGPEIKFKSLPAQQKTNTLACAIKTGKIHFWMIPYFIVYFIEFLVGISGLVAILFIVIGGYQFIIAGATDKKDTAKATIRNAILGLILVSVAWVIVNIIQFSLTI